MQNKNYIAVMGTLGVGKTTAASIIAKALKYTLIVENFGENAFLPRFYSDMKRWAFHSQTFFLMEKISQMMDTEKLLQTKSIVQDTPIVQDVFSYAKAQHMLGNMDDEEWRLYQKIYRSFEPYFPKPTLIIYLEASVGVIDKRVESRGREYEKKIPLSYLELLDMLNRKWVSENRDVPVLMIKTDELNVVKSTKARKELIALLKKRLQ